MATVEHPRRRDKGAAPQPPPRSGRRRVRRWLLAGSLLVLVYFAPAIVAHTSLLNVVLRSAVPVDGRLACGSASLGWFSPVVVENLELFDGKDKPVATIEKFSCDRTLLGLLTSRRNLGAIEVLRPVVHIESREDGSNIEDVLAPILKKPRRPDAIVPTCTVALADGQIHLHDARSGKEHTIDNLALSMELGAAGKSPLVLECSGKIASQNRAAPFKVALNSRPGPEAGGFGRGDVLVDCKSLPLVLLEIPARRVLAGAQLDGVATAKLSGAWGDGPQGDAGSLSGELVASRFSLSADALSGDTIRLAELRVPCELAIDLGRLTIRKLDAECDAGRASLAGSARLAELSAGPLVEGLARQDVKLSGQVDLAKLARLLPGTLRLREDVEITGGRLDFALESRKQADGPAWSGKLSTTGLAARAGGRNVVWQQPPNVTFAARQGKDGPIIDRFRCQSSFLSIDGAGSLDELSATAEFDLGRLKSELAQFIDLGEFDLAGTGTADVEWRTDKGRFTTKARFEAAGFRLAMKGQRPWSEATLDAQLDAAGSLDGMKLTGVESATLDVRAAGDRLQARLLQAVASPESTPWSIDVNWNGDLAALLPRLAGAIDTSDWEIAGAGSLTGMVMVSQRGLAIERGALDLDRVHVWGPGLYFDRPQATLRGDAVWKFDSGELIVEGGKLTAGSLDVDAKSVQFNVSSGTASGGLVAKAELAEIAGWLRDPQSAADISLAGQLGVQLDFAPRADGAQARLSASIERFEMASRAAPPVAALPRPGARPNPVRESAAAVWREPRIALATDATYKSSGELTLANFQVSSGGIELEAGGSVADLDGRRNVDLKGTIGCDWTKLAPLLQSLVGSELRLAGRDSRPFFVRGPLRTASGAVSWTDVAGEAAIGWSSAEVFAIPVGAGELVAKLGGGQLGIKPLDLPLSEGRLTLAPRLILAPEATLELSKGPLLKDVRLTPQICAHGLKYVHPILAEATLAEGTLSVDLDGARLPLANVKAGDVAARLRIVNGEIKPGPLAEELILIARQIEALAERKAPNLQVSRDARLKLSDQSVDVRMVQGRVYHRDLEFQVGRVTVRTHGSVGLDETLALVVEVPIQEAWVAKSPALGAIPDRRVQIPIGGTLSRWQVDRRALKDLLGQSLKNTARGLLLDQLDKQLEKLRPAEK